QESSPFHTPSCWAYCKPCESAIHDKWYASYGESYATHNPLDHHSACGKCRARAGFHVHQRPNDRVHDQEHVRTFSIWPAKGARCTARKVPAHERGRSMDDSLACRLSEPV